MREASGDRQQLTRQEMSRQEMSYMLDAFASLVRKTSRATFDDRATFRSLVGAYLVLGQRLAERSAIRCDDDATAVVSGAAEALRTVRTMVGS